MNKLFWLINCWILINICSCKNTSLSKANYDPDKNLADSVSKLYKQGKYLDVISLSTNLINKKDENILYRMLRAASYKILRKNDKGIVDLSYIIAFVPDSVTIDIDGEKNYCLRWALRNRGEILEELGNNEKALADFNHLLRLTNRNAPAISEMARIYQRMGNLDMADSLVAVAYNMDSSDVIVIANVGLIALHEANWEKAIVYLNKALSKGEDARYIMCRGTAYRYEKKYELAEKDFKRSIELDSNNTDSYSLYAGMLKEQGRKQEYCENLHKAMALGEVFDQKLLEECK